MKIVSGGYYRSNLSICVAKVISIRPKDILHASNLVEYVLYDEKGKKVQCGDYRTGCSFATLLNFKVWAKERVKPKVDI
jgi:hypothetical protein